LNSLSYDQMLEWQFTAIRESNRVAMSVCVGRQLSEGYLFGWTHLQMIPQMSRNIMKDKRRAWRNADSDDWVGVLSLKKAFDSVPKAPSARLAAVCGWTEVGG